MLNIKEILPFIIPALLVQVCLQVYSIIDLVRRRKVRFNSKLLWGIVIIVLEIPGTVAYLILRGDEA